MSADAEATGSAPLTVCIDFKNPHAWLAVPPTLALAQTLGIAVDWLPRIVAPIERPTPPGPDDDRGTLHRRYRAEYAVRDIERYAAVHGLTLRGLHRRPDTTLASLGLLWVRRGGPEAAQRYMTALFTGHFEEALELEDPAALRAVVEACGGDGAAFEAYTAGEGPTELDALQATLAERGVFTVPTYLVGGERFVGRAHLPLIREMLEQQAPGAH